MSIDLLLILAVIILGFASLFFWLQKRLSTSSSETEMENMVHRVFSLSSQKIAETSKQVLAGEKDAIKVDLENKQRVIEKLVKQLQDDMAKRQEEIRSVEQDRSKKFGQLSTQIEEHRKLTKELETSTTQLAKVLSNNQTRGGWGERIIEDLLIGQGLTEGQQYLRQTPLGTSTLRPDITLLLPEQRKVAVDVKFPYSEIQKMSETENKESRELHMQQFKRDLRAKIKKVAEYILPEQNTMDYAILFVPNEMVFSFINQKFSDVVDEAFDNRVLIVSPFTFIVVARTIIESYRNFMLEDRLREVVKHIDGFTQEWGRFKEQFVKYGRAIETLKGSYDTLTTTRFTQMERKIQKVESSHELQLNKSEEPLLIDELIEDAQ
jgi:DNA recombination protein RmuC